MPAASVLAFLAAVLPLVATPGASLTLLVREVGSGGRRRAAPVVLGTVSGLYVHASLAIAGLSALVLRSSQAFTAVRLAGAAYLVGLGVYMWRADRPKSADRARSAVAVAVAVSRPDSEPEPESGLESAAAFPVYRRALLANVLNPKAAAIYLTLAPQFLDPARPIAGQVLLLATAQGALVAVWLTGWTAVLSSARRLLGAPRARRTWTRVSACVLVILGVRNAAA